MDKEQQQEVEYMEIDVMKLATYLAEKDTIEQFKSVSGALWTAEIEEGKVRQVYTPEAASWVANQIEIYCTLIKLFKKPE